MKPDDSTESKKIATLQRELNELKAAYAVDIAAKEFEIAAKDAALEAKDAALEKSNLLNIMERFADLNQSVSTTGNKFDSDKIFGWGTKTVTSTPANEVLNIDSMDFISDDDSYWLEIMETKWKGLDTNAGEIKGIHPFINQVLTTLLKTNPRYSFVHEEMFNDGSGKPIKAHIKPDFSIILKNSVEAYDVSQLLVPIECKLKYEDINMGLNQSFGYAMRRILNQIEMQKDYKSYYHCYCFATDGNKLAIGKVIIKDASVTILGTISESSYLSLRKENDTESVPLGLRVLNYILTRSPEELGLPINGHYELNKNVNIISVLGMGSFCTVFRGKSTNEIGDTSFVAIKRPKYLTNRNLEPVQEMLLNEYSVLELLNKELNRTSVQSLRNWPTCAYPSIQNDIVPYIVFNDIGKDVKVLYSRLSSKNKSAFIIKIGKDITKALKHAHGLGWCHCDVRVENILAFEVSKGEYYFQLNDWGLAIKIGNNMHEYTGGQVFFHDEIVNKTVEEQTTVKVQENHDFAALFYSLVALKSFEYGKYTCAWILESRRLLALSRSNYIKSNNEIQKLCKRFESENMILFNIDYTI